MSEERPDWIASHHMPDVGGWYWMWSGFPKESPQMVFVTIDSHSKFVTTSLANGWVGVPYSVTAKTLPWRWSAPHVPPDVETVPT
jgi:hypothetical protein